ncbi:NGG1 interacting factor [Lignoscripta atroalba]|nr:NGG1 interacting factor [Lignoscripta atroalba]
MSGSTYTADKASPFTRAVVSSMRKLYPEALADKSFDNTGLLLEAPFDPIRRQMNSVLLTVDLTKAVADEAIERNDCVVVAYHPIIFKGLKALTLADTQQKSLLMLALEGISVYSPHTAIDAAPGGLGDWLADIVTGTLSEPEPATKTAEPETTETKFLETDSSDEKPADSGSDPFVEKKESPAEKTPQQRPSRMVLQRSYSRPTYPEPMELEQTDLEPSSARHKRTVIHSVTGVEGFESAGMGRLVTFQTPQPLTHLIERIARGVGNPKGFPVAIPQTRQVEDIQIRTVAICAGSGGSVLRDIDADLLFTGELSHHEALAATEKGRCVVTLFHSNTERGFLHSVLKEKLTATLKGEWKRVREEVRREGDLSPEWEDAVADEECLVEVSERDRDPFGIVILQSSKQVGKPLGGGSGGGGKD